MSIKKILQIFSLMYLLFLFIGFLLISKFDLFLYIAFFIPCVFWICWAKIKNESWDIPNKENRIIPLFFTLCYLVLLNLFWKSEFITIFLVNVSIILIITRFWKISMHNYGLSAMGSVQYGHLSIFVHIGLGRHQPYPPLGSSGAYHWSPPLSRGPLLLPSINIR
ncbi:hypothetical protein ACO3VM_00805 [Methanocaldococcus sp. 10A]